MDGDYYDCDELKHSLYGTCAAMYAYRRVNPLPALELTQFEQVLSSYFQNASKTIPAIIAEYFDGGIRVEANEIDNKTRSYVNANASLYFEWRTPLLQSRNTTAAVRSKPEGAAAAPTGNPTTNTAPTGIKAP
jgi:hypothetical protein